MIIYVKFGFNQKKYSEKKYFSKGPSKAHSK